MRDVVKFVRANPQAFVLLVICVVLGLGTFLAVLFGLITASPGTNAGEPSGAVLAAHAAAGGCGVLRGVRKRLLVEGNSGDDDRNGLRVAGTRARPRPLR